jgi:hypothetical protein
MCLLSKGEPHRFALHNDEHFARRRDFITLLKILIGYPRSKPVQAFAALTVTLIPPLDFVSLRSNPLHLGPRTGREVGERFEPRRRRLNVLSDLNSRSPS